MLTVVQAATILGVKPVTVRAWIAKGKLVRQPDGRVRNVDLLECWESRDTRMVALASQRWNRRIAS